MINKKISFTVNASLIKEACNFKSDDDIRFYLNAINIKPHPSLAGALISASNGHIATLIHDHDAEASEEVTVQITKTLLRNIKPNSFLVLDGGAISIRGNQKGTNEKKKLWIDPDPTLIDCQYPDLLKVIGKDKLTPGVNGSFNPEYLTIVSKFIVNAGKHPATTFYQNKTDGGVGPLIVEINDISYDAILAVMPMVHEPSNLAWLPKEEKRKKKAATKKKAVKKAVKKKATKKGG